MNSFFKFKDKRVNVSVELTKEQQTEFEMIVTKCTEFRDVLTKIITDNHLEYRSKNTAEPFSVHNVLNKEKLHELYTCSYYKDIPTTSLDGIVERVKNIFIEWYIKYKAKGDKVKIPDLKRKDGTQSFIIEAKDFEIKDGSITINGIPGNIKLDDSFVVPQRHSKIWVTKLESGDFILGFIYDQDLILDDKSGKVGIGIGYSGFLCLDTGDEIKYPKNTKQLFKDLSTAKKRMSYLKKNNSNTGYMWSKIKGLEKQIDEAMVSFIKQLVFELANGFKLIGIEFNASYKNKYILSKQKPLQGKYWGMFINLLTNEVKKSKHATMYLIDTKTPRGYICPKTNSVHEVKNEEEGERSWKCCFCHSKHHVDVASAVNVLKETEYHHMKMSKGKNPKGKTIHVRD